MFPLALYFHILFLDYQILFVSTVSRDEITIRYYLVNFIVRYVICVLVCVTLFIFSTICMCMLVYYLHLYFFISHLMIIVYIFSYLVNNLDIWWLYGGYTYLQFMYICKNNSDYVISILRNIISKRKTWRHSNIKLYLPPVITKCYKCILKLISTK